MHLRKNFFTLSDVEDSILSSENIEQIWTSIKTDEENILLGCFYRSQTCKDIGSISRSLERASTLVKNRSYSGILICGDFNLPLMNWVENGLPITNTDQAIYSSFSEAFIDTGLFQHVTFPTFIKSDGTSSNI